MLESPLWLVAKGKLTQAEKVLRKMAKYNGVRGADVSLTQQNETLLVDESSSKTTKDSQSNGTLVHRDATSPENQGTSKSVEVGQTKHLITDPVLRKHFVVCCFIW